MATSYALSRQPDVLDYASPTQFSFVINQLPKVQFFTTACSLPGITLGTTTFPTRFTQVPIQGDNVTFESFSLSFIVDEHLENYLSLHDWITGAGFPKSTEQFQTFRDETSETSDLGYQKSGTRTSNQGESRTDPNSTHHVANMFGDVSSYRGGKRTTSRSSSTTKNTYDWHVKYKCVK